MNDEASARDRSEVHRYFYDTEFWERGPEHPISLLSIGIVADDGREFYAVNADAPWDEIATASDAAWLRENVLPWLGDERQALREIRDGLTAFLRPRADELWAYFADYDHVVLCQIFGRMIDLPDGMPMFTCDVKQEIERKRVPRDRLPVQHGVEHHALADARWTHDAWRALRRWS